MLGRFVAVDLETTGLNAGQDEIIELGAVRFLAGAPAERFSVLVRPGVPLPLRIKRLTGISDADLTGAEPLGTALPRFLAWLGDDPLVGHNLPFDLEFLTLGAQRLGHSFVAARTFDTLELARAVLPSERHALRELAPRFGLDAGPQHRGAPDAEVAGRLFLLLCDQVAALPPALLVLCDRLLAPVEGGLRDVFSAAAGAALAQPLSGRRRRFVPKLPADLAFAEPADERAAPDELPEPRPIDARAIAADFGPTGPFAAQLPGYEHRRPQAEMAQAVARALNRGEHLLVEAGTGTGKSMAYLLPAYRFAIANDERVVIATHTINLQEQLWNKDLPLLGQVLGETIPCALVKGRANYLCLRKWLDLVEDDEPFLTTEERLFHVRLAVWLNQTATGDRGELNLYGPAEQLWARVASDGLACQGNFCRFNRAGCYVMRARRAAEQARVLIVNHSLLFADLEMDGRVLPTYRHLVIDEAHNVEAAATQHLGADYGHYGLRSWLASMFSGFRSGNPGYIGVLRGRLQRLTQRVRSAGEALPAVEDCLSLIRDVLESVDELFGLVRQFGEREGSDDDEGSLTVRVTASRREGDAWRAVQSAGDNLTGRLRRLSTRLNALSDALGQLNEDHGSPLKGVPEDLAAFAAAAHNNAQGLTQILAADRADWVYWIQTDRAPDRLRGMIYAAPVRVGDILRERLFDKQRSVVLTSATLTVRGEFGFVADRLGLADYGPERLTSRAVASPFHYREQALCCVPNDLPQPRSGGEREFRRAVTDFLDRLLRITQGRTLVLFTSHRMLRDVYTRLKPGLEAADICLLGQGIDGSRSRLVEDLQTTERTAIFGASSFWEGVDIPGEQLSCVVIVKLPFAPPDEPVNEARNEDIVRRGGSAFYGLSLPQAVIRFKQGFGRLIRRKDDSGVVVVLDPRVADRECRYGRHFLDSLPGPTLLNAPQAETLTEIDQWLGGARTPSVTWTLPH